MTELRKMEKTDIPVCGEIHYSAFYQNLRATLTEHMPEAEKEFCEGFDFDHYYFRFIEDKDKYAFCIIGDGQTVGYLTALEIPSFGDEPTIYIDSIAVAPEYQQHGYGSDAMQQFLDMFPKSATKRLQTTKDRPAYKMYEKLGFADVDMRVMESSAIMERLINARKALEQIKRENNAQSTSE